MSTGLETWNMNLLEIGPLYPFAGIEMLLALVGIVSWIIWHVMQIKAENRVYEEDEKAYSDKEALAKAMRDSNAETLMERLRAHRVNYDD